MHGEHRRRVDLERDPDRLAAGPGADDSGCGAARRSTDRAAAGARRVRALAFAGRARGAPVKDLRADFPLLARRELIYLDSAATSQKPRQVIEAVSRFYESSNANVHRGVYRLAEEADKELDDAREAVRRFIRAPETAGVIFTR